MACQNQLTPNTVYLEKEIKNRVKKKQGKFKKTYNYHYFYVNLFFSNVENFQLCPWKG
jgi:hypothetical protein